MPEFHGHSFLFLRLNYEPPKGLREGWELRVFRPKGKTHTGELIRLQYCVIIKLSVQDIKTYRGTLGKYTLVRYDFALWANEVRARTQY